MLSCDGLNPSYDRHVAEVVNQSPRSPLWDVRNGNKQREQVVLAGVPGEVDVPERVKLFGRDRGVSCDPGVARETDLSCSAMTGK